MSYGSTSYVKDATPELDGKAHEVGREFRSMKLPDGKLWLEFRTTVKANGAQYAGPWQKLEPVQA